MQLQGERCVLRPWRARDLAALVRHADNSNVSRYLRERFPHPYTRKDARGFLSTVTRGAGDGRKMAIEVGGEAVGGIGVVPGTDIERFSAELGYWLGEAYWGRGIATEAVALFTDHAFARFNLLRLFAVAAAANVASARVLEKAGYQQEGRLRSAAVKFGQAHDQLLYARINPDWRGVDG